MVILFYGVVNDGTGVGSGEACRYRDKNVDRWLRDNASVVFSWQMLADYHKVICTFNV